MRRLKRPLQLVLVAAFFGLAACNYDYIEFEKPSGTVHFSTDIEPIFNNNEKCTSCHKPGEQAPDLTTGHAYASIDSMKLVNTTDPPSSLIYKYPDPANSVDHTWKKYTSYEADLVLTWIEQGALDN